MTKPDDLVKVMEEFIKNTIHGHESGFYKTLYLGQNVLKSDHMDGLIVVAAANYLNQAYKSLILDDDEYFMKYFNGMSSIMSHSHICLLNIVFAFLVKIHRAMDRDKFNIASYPKYMDSVKVELDEVFNSMRDEVVGSISHDCTGSNIKECDPNVDLFVIK